MSHCTPIYLIVIKQNHLQMVIVHMKFIQGRRPSSEVAYHWHGGGFEQGGGAARVMERPCRGARVGQGGSGLSKVEPRSDKVAVDQVGRRRRQE